MSIWNTSTGESAISNETSYEDESGGFGKPVPEGSTVLAMIDKSAWKTSTKDLQSMSINTQWVILKPEPFVNRKIWQNLWVKDLDPHSTDKEKAIKRRDRDLRKLSIMDNNARKKLRECTDDFTNDDLATLNNAMMVIELGLMGDMNYIRNIYEKTHPINIAEEVKPANGPHNPSLKDLGEEIPF